MGYAIRLSISVAWARSLNFRFTAFTIFSSRHNVVLLYWLQAKIMREFIFFLEAFACKLWTLIVPSVLIEQLGGTACSLGFLM